MFLRVAGDSTISESVSCTTSSPPNSDPIKATASTAPESPEITTKRFLSANCLYKRRICLETSFTAALIDSVVTVILAFSCSSNKLSA